MPAERCGVIRAVTVEYRVSRPLLVRSAGALLVVVGGAVLLLALVVAVLALPVLVLSVGVVVAVVAVAGTGLLVARSPSVVRMDDDGYQVGLLRRPGVRRARWRDVEDVVTATLSGHPCVVIRLKDGSTTTIPLAAVDSAPDAFLRDLRDHLDRGHGYRRIR
jgi:hypothetical protein